MLKRTIAGCMIFLCAQVQASDFVTLPLIKQHQLGEQFIYHSGAEGEPVLEIALRQQGDKMQWRFRNLSGRDIACVGLSTRSYLAEDVYVHLGFGCSFSLAAGEQHQILEQATITAGEKVRELDMDALYFAFAKGEAPHKVAFDFSASGGSKGLLLTPPAAAP
ncbi:MAG: hypothetical protein ACPG4U_13465 [Pseudomonadales bacterium]